MLTYSQNIKMESLQSKNLCKNCNSFFIKGYFLAIKYMLTDSNFMFNEQKDIAECIVNVIENEFSVIPELAYLKLYSYVTIRMSISDYNIMFKDILKTKFKEIKNDIPFCCKSNFVRGVYVASGSCNNPQNEYHLEIVNDNKELLDTIKYIMNDNSIDLHETKRKNKYILYIKDSETIEEFLTYIGAVKSAIELMNLKIEKEIRNRANRVTNCETANITKMVNASQAQIEKILYIKETIGLESLPIELYDLSVLRLMNPEVSLKELCFLQNGNLSRSGINHRLNKICKIADEIKENNIVEE